MIATNLLQSLMGRNAGTGLDRNGSFIIPPANGGVRLPMDEQPFGMARRAAPAPMAPAAPAAINPDALKGIFDQLNQGQGSASSLASMPQPDLAMPAAAPPKPRGVFDRIGDFIKSDEGKAILLRSGAATIDGGLGAGIAAGANYAADRKEAQQKQDNWLAELGVKQQEADQTGEYRRGALRNDANQTAIAASKAAADERIRLQELGFKGAELEAKMGQWDAENGIARERINVDREGHTVQMRGQDVTERGNIRSTDASRYGADRGYQAAQERGSAGIGTNWSVQTKLPDTGQTVTQTTRYPQPSGAAVELLKGNPGQRALFESTYGPNSASRYLSGR